MIGKGKKLADMMERKKVDMLCVQKKKKKLGGWEIRLGVSERGSYSSTIVQMDGMKNGIGVIPKEEYVKSVLEVSDRMMRMKLKIEGVMINVVSACAPQVGCGMHEKAEFWRELGEVVEKVPKGERMAIGAGYSGHVGEGNRGDEGVMGRYGVWEQDAKGQMVVDFAKKG